MFVWWSEVAYILGISKRISKTVARRFKRLRSASYDRKYRKAAIKSRDAHL